MDRLDVDVLVIGAGPCGLMVANELGRRGIATLVADQESGVATAPQANATQARSMEHYRRLGFAHEIRALGLPADYPTDIAYFTTFTGYELARHEQPPSGLAATRIRELAHVWNGAELPHRVAQSLVEKVLFQHAAQLKSVSISFNWRAVGFEEHPDHVVSHLLHAQSGEPQTVRSRYLFAADGGASVTRKQLGIGYSGGDAAERDFMGGRMLSIYIDAPAFYEKVKVPRAWMYWTFNRRRRALLAATDGLGRFVMQTQLRKHEDPDSMTTAEAGQLFLQAVGRDIPFKVTGIASWLAGRALVAEHFGRGRVLLGGDAVHLFTPTGGMGYNTAIEDAVNIGWKLAAVVHGQAHPALLASYEAERRAVALRNTRFAAGFADSVGLYVPSPAIESEGPAGDAARRRAGAYLGQHGRNEFTIPGFTFGARYNDSPVIPDDGAPLPPDVPTVYVPSGKPGGRAPHVWRPDGSSLFDHFGFDWTLLSFVSAELVPGVFRDEAARRGIDLVHLDLHDDLIACDLYEANYALIRPDQIVAWRGQTADAASVAQLFDRVLGYPRATATRVAAAG
jgi:2-polyprenyl-6-methoxyphenol hydroxylase-like FAD-dependent oxidoreductase